jgi:hypothetical protein
VAGIHDIHVVNKPWCQQGALLLCTDGLLMTVTNRVYNVVRLVVGRLCGFREWLHGVHNHGMWFVYQVLHTLCLDTEDLLF